MSESEGAADGESPPRLVDTHCHLADAALEPDARALVERAERAGVAHTVVVGETPEAAARALALARTDRRLSATAGLHPHEARRWTAELADWLDRALGDPLVVAAGEMGLDYHYDHSPREAQRAAFEAQMDSARRAGKPAVIHAREADDDVAAVLANHPKTVAILHSFSSGPAVLRAALALGHYVSVSGMITFKSWSQDDALRSVPAERLLVETDAPYLAPVPYRGKTNEPSYVVATARRLAQVIGRSFEEIAALTSANAARVFGPRVLTA
jgi:TatD DNase family protein